MSATRKQAARLRQLRVTELSLVPSGANEAALVVLRKSRIGAAGAERLLALAKARAAELTRAKRSGPFETCSDCPDRAMCHGRRTCGIETPVRAVRKSGGAGLVDLAKARAAEILRDRR